MVLKTVKNWYKNRYQNISISIGGQRTIYEKEEQSFMRSRCPEGYYGQSAFTVFPFTPLCDVCTEDQIYCQFQYMKSHMWNMCGISSSTYTGK